MQNMTPIHNRRTIRAALAAFKGNIYQKHIRSRIVLPHHYKNILNKRVSLTKQIFSVENRLFLLYLGEFEAEFKKALARESGTQGGLFDGKKPKIENLVTLSLLLVCPLDLL
jgi:hypothetical protein